MMRGAGLGPRVRSASEPCSRTPPLCPASTTGRPLRIRSLTGAFVVECSSCAAVTRVGVVDFLFFQFPVGFWLPRGRFDRRMTCPACRRRVWASVTLRRGERPGVLGAGPIEDSGHRAVNIHHLIESYGYWAVFLLVALESFGVPLPGETALIAAATYAGPPTACRSG